MNALAQRVRQAQAELASAQRDLQRDWAPWRARLRRHRAAAIVIGGMAGGAALALLPVRWWSGVGAVLGRVAALAARSTLTPALAAAALARVRGTTPRRPPAHAG